MPRLAKWICHKCDLENRCPASAFQKCDACGYHRCAASEPPLQSNETSNQGSLGAWLCDGIDCYNVNRKEDHSCSWDDCQRSRIDVGFTMVGHGIPVHPRGRQRQLETVRAGRGRMDHLLENWDGEKWHPHSSRGARRPASPAHGLGGQEQPEEHPVRVPRARAHPEEEHFAYAQQDQDGYGPEPPRRHGYQPDYAQYDDPEPMYPVNRVDFQDMVAAPSRGGGYATRETMAEGYLDDDYDAGYGMQQQPQYDMGPQYDMDEEQEWEDDQYGRPRYAYGRRH